MVTGLERQILEELEGLSDVGVEAKRGGERRAAVEFQNGKE